MTFLPKTPPPRADTPGAGSGAALLARVRQCPPRDCALLLAPPASTHAGRVASFSTLETTASNHTPHKLEQGACR